MTVMPDVNDLIDPSVTELAYQTALEAFYNVVNEMATQGEPEEIDIASGSVTPAKANMILDTEAAAASDDLTNVVATTIGAKMLFLRIASDARNVVLKHNAGGGGKLMLRTGADTTMTNVNQLIVFQYNVASTSWIEIFRNWGVYAPATADQTAARTALGLGALATKNTVAAGDIDSDAISTVKVIDNNITLNKLATQAANSFLANASSSTAIPSAVGLSASQLAGRGSTGNIAPITLGTGLTMSGTTLSAGSGGAIDIQTFTSSGTWTKPGSGTYAIIRGLGGGGSGGSSSSASHGGGGGGGGAYKEIILPLSALSATETVTIGAGGASVTSGTGNPGGNTTLGTKFIVYGGGAGAGSSTAVKGGGGGGGATSRGEDGGNISLTFDVSANIGKVLSNQWKTVLSSNIGGGPNPGFPNTATGEFHSAPGPFGGAAGGTGSAGSAIGGITPTWHTLDECFTATGGYPTQPDGGFAYYGGAGGGVGGSTSAGGGAGGASIFGGGGGGGGAGDSAPGPGKGGLSKYAGKGGDGGYDTNPGTAGTAPAGGGGGSETGTASGAGARGELTVIVI